MNLTPKTDIELALLAQAGNREAEEVLTLRYWDLMGILANAYPIRGTEHEDRQVICLEALVKAIRTYGADKGTKFKTWAKMLVSRALTDAHREAHQVGVVPPSAMRSLDVGMGDDEDITMSEIIPGKDDTGRDAMDREEVGRRFAKAMQDQWLSLVDAIEGEPDPETVKLIDAMLAFSGAALPTAYTQVLRSLMGGQASLFDPASERGTDEAEGVAKSVHEAYTKAQVRIALDLAHGYEYSEIASRLTFELQDLCPGIRIKPELVGEIVRALKGAADDEQELRAA